MIISETNLWHSRPEIANKDKLGCAKVMTLSITKLDSHIHNAVYALLLGLASISQDINNFGLVMQ
jgi:hypothetical protein